MNYSIVSAFSLATLGGALAAIIKFSGGAGPSDDYYLVLDNVSDIKYGTQVSYEEFPICQIEAISPFEKGGRMRFRIGLSVTEDWKIPDDSLARIGASNLLAAKTIDIRAGLAGAAIKAGPHIPTAAPVGMFSVIASVTEQFGDLSQSSLKPMVEDFRSMANRLGAQFETDLGTLMGSLTQTPTDIRGRVRAAQPLERRIGKADI